MEVPTNGLSSCFSPCIFSSLPLQRSHLSPKRHSDSILGYYFPRTGSHLVAFLWIHCLFMVAMPCHCRYVLLHTWTLVCPYFVFLLYAHRYYCQTDLLQIPLYKLSCFVLSVPEFFSYVDHEGLTGVLVYQFPKSSGHLV